MRGKVILLSLLVIFLLAFAHAFFSGKDARAQEVGPSLKIAVVNIEEVFNNYKKKPLLDEELARWQADKQKEMDAKRKELEILQARVENLAPESEERTRAEEELLKKKISLEASRQLILKQAKKKQLDFFREIWQDIYSVISRYAEEKGYDLILKSDERRLDSPVFTELQYNIHRTIVLYNSSRVDISKDIIHLLNAQVQSEKE